jgi:ferritin-like metal-binding protein YciE
MDEVMKLMVEQLRDVYSAEKQGLRAMPRLARKATAHSDDCSHRFRSKPATCSDRSQPGIPMIPAG